jgi:DNA invertase Pin-like site-specific DNA recombinase
MNLNIEDDFVLIENENENELVNKLENELENVDNDVFMSENDELILGNNNIYPVDKLLDIRILNGKTQYLVKWEGNYDNTWEPEENINPSLIRSFMIDQQVINHNNQINKNTQNNKNNMYAHLYLRVSDRDKTNLLFRRHNNFLQQQKPQNTQNPVDNTHNLQGNFQNMSYQAYFAEFPEGNFSLDSQKDILMKYCIEKNMKIKSIEFDDGVSARNPLKLKGLRNIINNISKNEILLILDLSRFSRNTKYGIELLNELEGKGAKIYSVLDGMNYDTPSAKHCVRTTLSCAQMESDVKSIKIKNSLNNILSKGGYLGGIPKFGYKVIRDGVLRKLIKNDDEYHILNMIGEYLYQFENNRFKYRIISDKLNENNITMRGKKFTNKIITRLVKTHSIKPIETHIKVNNNDTHLKRQIIFNKNRKNLNQDNISNHTYIEYHMEKLNIGPNDNIIEI